MITTRDEREEHSGALGLSALVSGIIRVIVAEVVLHAASWFVSSASPIG